MSAAIKTQTTRPIAQKNHPFDRSTVRMSDVVLPSSAFVSSGFADVGSGGGGDAGSEAGW